MWAQWKIERKGGRSGRGREKKRKERLEGGERERLEEGVKEREVI